MVCSCKPTQSLWYNNNFNGSRGTPFGRGDRILSSLDNCLGERRSIEIDIKQMMVGAKEEAQKITDEAKKEVRGTAF